MENTFANEITELCKKHGRKLNWVIAQTNCDTRTFQTLKSVNAFNNSQQATIRAIITGEKVAVGKAKIKLI